MDKIKKDDFWFQYSGYLPAFATFMVGAWLLLFIAIPNYPRLAQLDDQIKTLTEQTDQLNRKQLALQGFNSTDLDDLSKKTEVAVPSEKSFPGLLSGLEFLAAQANSQLISFDSSPGLLANATGSAELKKEAEAVSKEKLPAGMGSLLAIAGVNSNSANLIDLTRSLVKSGRLVTIESVSYDSTNSKGQSENTQIKLRVYFQPPPANLEDIARLAPITISERNMVSTVDSYNQFALQNIPDLPSRADPFAQNGKTAPVAQPISTPVKPK